MTSFFILIFHYIKKSRILCSLFLLAGAFTLGSLLGILTGTLSTTQETSASAQSASWGLSFQEEGKRPVGNATIDDLKQYNAYYASNTDEKILYLTFDAGYENGNTPAILDALGKHQAPAVFFAVGNFIKDNPDLIKRIVSEGHIVGNHTMTHPDMSQISSMESFQKELEGVEELYKSVTGESMTKFYRPPRGVYSTENLSMAKELGYSTFFWSLAYVDWIQDQQPTSEEAFQKLLPRVHPGAIVLLHNTSSTNASILDELLTKWEEMGYQFHSIKELTEV
nr:polysaccharide deacetylase family protein [uncultured Blautia sp.]